MIEVKNKFNQPLSLSRVGGPGLCLGARERVLIKDNEVSGEMKRLNAQGLISLREVGNDSNPEVSASPVTEEATAPVNEGEPTEQPAHSRNSRRGGK